MIIRWWLVGPDEWIREVTDRAVRTLRIVEQDYRELIGDIRHEPVRTLPPFDENPIDGTDAHGRLTLMLPPRRRGMVDVAWVYGMVPGAESAPMGLCVIYGGNLTRSDADGTYLGQRYDGERKAAWLLAHELFSHLVTDVGHAGPLYSLTLGRQTLSVYSSWVTYAAGDRAMLLPYELAELRAAHIATGGATVTDPVIERINAPTYTSRPRTQPPRIGLIHATRGHTSLELQDDATRNYFRDAPDRGGWGPTADVLISADENRITEFRDLLTQRSAFSAGYGPLGYRYEYAADEWAISIELAQTPAQEPYSDAIIGRLVWYVEHRLRGELGIDIPAVRLGPWDQRRSDPVPSGWLGHEDTAHGRRAGKTDPGAQFPWGYFLGILGAASEPEPEALSPPLESADTIRIYRHVAGIRQASGEVQSERLPVADGWREYKLRIRP